MRWQYFPEALLLFLVLALESHRRWNARAVDVIKPNSPGWTPEKKFIARERTRDLWYHGFNNYMEHAFPFDELTPLSCSGQGPDWANPANIASNDVAGNFSLTLIDALDTLVVLGDQQGFEASVKSVIDHVSFASDVKPQVFETTIRVLGGLLSAHQFATKRSSPFYLPWYQNELLSLAYDLGTRLLPAFSTPTGLPYSRINLRSGVMRGESPETCSAGAGSLILEFATLSRLTGDPRFEKAAHKAFFAVWNRKSDIGLVGNTINVQTGEWTYPVVTGIGAGIDSFYEYALKWYILSGEPEYLDVWDDAYSTIMRYSRSVDGFWYRQVNMNSGETAYHTIDSLAAFWPGLQVLSGDLDAAIKLHLLYYNLWRKHSGLPEVYDTNAKVATSHQYPLRPEFVESTWYLYRATGDPFYLDVAERVLFDLSTRAKVGCGLSGIQDLRTNKRDDRMESFALSETLKYLYLLFDEDNFLHRDDSNYVFTTEGHILTMEPSLTKPLSPARQKHGQYGRHQCPAYDPLSTWSRINEDTGLRLGIRSRIDYDYARELVGQSPNENDKNAWSAHGWCARPKVDIYAFDIVLSATGRNVKEDLSPSLVKLAPVTGGYVIHDISGIRAHIVRRLDGKGYDIRKLGHYPVRPGNIVYINDSSLFQNPHEQVASQNVRDPEVTLNFFMDAVDVQMQIPANLGMSDEASYMDDLQLTATAYTSLFAMDLSPSAIQFSPNTTRFTSGDALPLYWESDNLMGCEPFQQSNMDAIVLTYRGECTFLEKLVHAKTAGGLGVVVVGDEDVMINPTANNDELEAAGELDGVFLVILPFSEGQRLTEMMERGEQRGAGQIFVALARDTGTPPVDENAEAASQEEVADTATRHLYLNNLPLMNTKLLV